VQNIFLIYNLFPMKYNRILLKLSGEALMGSQQYGIDSERLSNYAHEIKLAHETGVQIAIVIGGGNIFRGLSGASQGMDRVQGDYMGMLATVINSMALQGALQGIGLATKLLGGLEIDPIAERMSRQRALEYLNDNKIVIISGGTGNPYFTTDTASALRAIEIQADVILKGTRVDGVYDKDPEKYSDAVKYASLSFTEAYEKKLAIMDLTSFTLCQENDLPIYVFNMNKTNELLKVINGDNVGTLVCNN
jgi:uridylate kinase